MYTLSVPCSPLTRFTCPNNLKNFRSSSSLILSHHSLWALFLHFLICPSCLLCNLHVPHTRFARTPNTSHTSLTYTSHVPQNHLTRTSHALHTYLKCISHKPHRHITHTPQNHLTCISHAPHMKTFALSRFTLEENYRQLFAMTCSHAKHRSIVCDRGSIARASSVRRVYFNCSWM